MLNELQERKTELRNKSEEYKNKRNELNMEASKLASKRNELNSKTKELVEEAQKIKELRDENNKQVSENKKKRDELNEQANKVYAEIDKIRKDLNLSDGPSLKELSREIDRLEFKQQTEVMSPGKERELVDSIATLREEFKRKRDQLEGNDELKDLMEKAQLLRDEASVYHNKVKEYADAAQKYHDSMIELFKQADAMRAESDKVHKEFVTIQDSADEQHQLFIKTQKEIRDFNKVILGLRKKEKTREDEAFQDQAQQEAEDLYEKFKKGVKLDTEALMTMQRSKLL